MTVPVGKVQVMRMYPITFKEYLRASDIQTFTYVEQIEEPEKLPLIILDKLKSEYRRYMVSGGMPEAAVSMLENQGMQAVDGILQGILDLYELDFAKYADPREIPRIHALWRSLPSQLAKENRKFIYKVVKKAQGAVIRGCFALAGRCRHDISCERRLETWNAIERLRRTRHIQGICQ